ncbi:MAG: sodium:alanine symporter family protein [Oscillospiraceae bacterium]
MDFLMEVLEKIQSIVWGPPTLILLVGTGLYFTFRLKFLQITKFGKSMKLIFEKEEGQGDVSAFGSLCTTLAATIGTGSIVGVATALRTGGPGALFWMWVSAFLGMTTKYAEGLLAVKYRTVDENGEMAGGPMYYIQNGMGKKWIWLAKIFAIFGAITALFGCGTFPQVNAITESLNDAFNLPVFLTGAILTIAVALVVIGGISSISKIAEYVVPFMAGFFVIGSLIIIGLNLSKIPAVFVKIFESAFNPTAVAGGVTGTVIISIMTAIRTGVARGVYTNESGLGSSPIVAAAAKTNSCVRQGLISMTSVFFTTIVTCTVTGIVIMISGLLDSSTLDGSILANSAYNLGLPYNLGTFIVTFGIIFFSFTTIIGWCYYGERCTLYLTGKIKSIKVFKCLYIVAIALAPALSLKPIWLIADITNALMAFPNLIALLCLSKVVIDETEKYFAPNAKQLQKTAKSNCK